MGGTNYIKLNAGLIFASNVDLSNAMAQRLFRSDLYYRISGCVIRIPSLRDRVEELEELINYFVVNKSLKPLKFTEEAMFRLRKYEWPGNIRELLNYLFLWDSTTTGMVDVVDLPDKILDGNNDLDYKRALNRFRKEFLIRVLKIFNWDIKTASEEMHISRQHLYKLVRQLDIKFPAVDGKRKG